MRRACARKSHGWGREGGALGVVGGRSREIDDAKGPVLAHTVRDAAAVAALHALDLTALPFIGESLTALRAEVGPSGAAVLGFVGAPFTLATYIVEGRDSIFFLLFFRRSRPT